MSTDPRPRSAIDALAEELLDAYAALDPESATLSGIAGHDHRLTDHSVAGVAERTALFRQVLRRLDGLKPKDATDVVTADLLRERGEAEVAMGSTGEHAAALDVLGSPVQRMREVFDLMPTADDADHSVVAERLRAVPEAVATYVSALRDSAAAGRVAARRQLLATAVQCDDNVGPGGFFVQLAGRARTAVLDEGSDPLTEDLLTELEEAARGASDAYAALARVMREELLPQAPEADAVGAERYAVRLRYYLGEDVDLQETYRWGVAEVERLLAEGTEVAGRLGASTVAGAVELLEHDPARLVHGAEAFRDWMQATSDEAVALLGGTHFDIPASIRTLDCRIAPSSTGVVYYTPPSEDLTRSGSMWWSVPKGMSSFGTWQQRTTVYHEGVPGHHLQIAQTLLRTEELNRYRRLTWVSGHGEGWALYAENLMAELGHLDDPGDRLGLIASQLLRSVRVVLDIGVHCGFEAPARAGGGGWTYDKAWAYLTTVVPEPEATLRFELDRYLGHPGQAPSYKVGERVWLQLREQARQQATERGEELDLVAWHRRALDLGSVGLGTLRRALAG